MSITTTRNTPTVSPAIVQQQDGISESKGPDAAQSTPATQQTHQAKVTADTTERTQKKHDRGADAPQEEMPAEARAKLLTHLQSKDLGPKPTIAPAEPLTLTIAIDGELPLSPADLAGLVALDPKDIKDPRTRAAMQALIALARDVLTHQPMPNNVDAKLQGYARKLVDVLRDAFPKYKDAQLEQAFAALQKHRSLTPTAMAALRAFFGHVPAGVMQRLARLSKSTVDAASTVARELDNDETIDTKPTDPSRHDSVEPRAPDQAQTALMDALQPVVLPLHDETDPKHQDALQGLLGNMLESGADLETVVQLVMMQISKDDKEEVNALLKRMDARRLEKQAMKDQLSQLERLQAELPEQADAGDVDSAFPGGVVDSALPAGVTDALLAQRLNIPVEDLASLREVFESMTPEVLTALSPMNSAPDFLGWLTRSAELGGVGLKAVDGVENQHATVAAALNSYPKKIADAQAHIAARAAKKAEKERKRSELAASFGLSPDQVLFVEHKYNTSKSTLGIEDYCKQKLGLSTTAKDGNFGKVDAMMREKDGLRALSELGTTYQLNDSDILALWDNFRGKQNIAATDYTLAQSAFPAFLEDLGLTEGVNNKRTVDAYFDKLEKKSPAAALEAIDGALDGDPRFYVVRAAQASALIADFGTQLGGNQNKLDKAIKAYIYDMVWYQYDKHQDDWARNDGRYKRYNPDQKFTDIANLISGFPADKKAAACDYFQMRMLEFMRDMTKASGPDACEAWKNAGVGAAAGAGIGAAIGTVVMPLIGTAIGAAVGAGIGAVAGGQNSDREGFWSAYLDDDMFGEDGFKLNDSADDKEGGEGKGHVGWSMSMKGATRGNVLTQVGKDLFAGSKDLMREAVFGDNPPTPDYAVADARAAGDYDHDPRRAGVNPRAPKQAKDANAPKTEREQKLAEAKEKAKQKAREKAAAARLQMAESESARDFLTAPPPRSAPKESPSPAPAPVPSEDLSKLSAQELQARIDTLKNQIDGQADVSDMDQLKLQMLMERYSKVSTMLSNLMKKIADNSQVIVGNMK